VTPPNTDGSKSKAIYKERIHEQVKTYMAVYFGAALFAIFLMPVVSRLAKRYRLVDAPGPRKVHQVPIPRVGGVVFLLSTLVLVLPVFLLNNTIGQSFREADTQFIVLFVAAGFVFAVGFVDDLLSVRAYIKLLCLIGAALAVCASGATIREISVGTWFELKTGWGAWPLTVLWIVTITVCMNMIDGLDGLAGGISAIVCGTLVVLAIWSDYGAMAVLMLALLGSVSGFLFFNWHPAKIFMGDGGSMFLGFMIGAGSIVCQTKTSTLVGLALPFLVLGVPILDTGLAILRRRVLERRSIFAADRGHLHHRLLDLGLQQHAVVIVIYAVTIMIAAIGAIALAAGGKWSVGLLICGLLLLFAIVGVLHSQRYSEILETLKRNWVISQEARMERRSFEQAQVEMRESKSFDAWWETMCAMAMKMQFQGVGLWRRHNGRYERICAWSVPEEERTNDRTVRLALPLNGNGAEEWEIRAHIVANGYLELIGRQAMLLGRLLDEFPPPDQTEEAEAVGRSGDIATGLTVSGEALPSL